MARLFDDSGSDEWLSHAASLIGGPPCTWSAWAKPDAVRAQYIFVEGDQDVSNRYRLFTFTGGQTLRVQQRGPTANNGSNTVNTWTVNDWNHAVISFTDNTTRDAVLNGDLANRASGSTDTGDIDADIDLSTIGVGTFNGSRFSYFGGCLDHLAFWDVILTDNEKVELAGGAHPFGIRPLSLQYFYQLGLTSPERNWLSTNKTFTVNGSPPRAAGPPVRPWHRSKGDIPFIVPAAAGGDGTDIPWPVTEQPFPHEQKVSSYQ